MTMRANTDNLIDSLVGDLDPVRPMRVWSGLALFGAAVLATVVMVAAVYGLRGDIAVGRFEPLFLFSNGLFLLLGIASALTVISMSMPQVGSHHQGWKWAAATTCLLPVTAAIALISRTAPMPAQWVSHEESSCLAAGVGLGLLTAVMLVAWLRRGAPIRPERAGLLVGIAAGSIGILAAAIHCPSNSVYHIGLWHTAPILISALIGWLLVPRLIRW